MCNNFTQFLFKIRVSGVFVLQSSALFISVGGFGSNVRLKVWMKGCSFNVCEIVWKVLVEFELENGSEIKF